MMKNTLLLLLITLVSYGYNSAQTTRAWGTYFGGPGNEGYEIGDVATDVQGNIYVVGSTQSTANIATNGAYRTNHLGGYDPFLVKFDPSGNVLWATYYGGTGSYDHGQNIEIDPSGNVYISGTTDSPNFMTSPGAYDVTLTGTNDAFLAKFDPNGNRLWATYYGGSGGGYYSNVETDPFGNVYLCTAGGNNNAMLVKFSSTGSYQWEISFDSYSVETPYAMAADGLGNIYLCGETSSVNGIAVGGAQMVHGGGGRDAFLVKFTSAGSIIWATYYGGSGSDEGYAVALDASNNVYLSGITNSPNNIAFNGHQNVLGGTRGHFLAKFSASGTRLWGTYYGPTTGTVNGFTGLSINPSGKVFMSGSANSSFGIGYGGFQGGYGGGTNDAYLVQFDSNGVHVAATLYGGSGADGDVGSSCAADNFGNVYLSGFTTSGNNIAFNGYQNTIAGNGDMFLVKFGTGCAPQQPGAISGPASICPGSTQTYSVPNSPDATGYTWTLPNGWTGTSNTNSITVTADNMPGTISVRAYNNCTSSVVRTLSVNIIQAPFTPSAITGNTSICTGSTHTYAIVNDPNASTYTWTLPNGWTGNSTTNSITATANNTGGVISVMAVNSCGTTSPAQTVTISINQLNVNISTLQNAICAGGSTTLNASGATSYTWQPGNQTGSSITVSPQSTQNYIVTGTDGSGCAGSDTITITVNVLPNVSAGNNQNICAGSPVTLSGTGAQNYTWNNGVINGMPFNPNITNSYIVTGTDQNNCSDTDTVTVFVNALPNVNAGNDQTVCAGTSVTLSGGGAQNYSWNNGISNNTPFTPISTNTYIVTGTDINNCSNTDTVTVTVNPLPNVSAGNNQTVCAGTPVTLSGSGAVSYSWNNGVVDGVPFTPGLTNSYIVIGTDANGCSNGDLVTVLVNQLPQVNAGNDQTVCAGTSITLSGSGAQNYSWNNGVTNGLPFTPVSTNSYIVTGTDINNCSKTDTVTVSVNPLPNVDLNYSGQTFFCVNETAVALNGGLPAGGTYSGPGVNGNNFDPAVAGTGNHYIIYTYTDNNSCSNSDSVQLNVQSCLGENMEETVISVLAFPNPGRENLTLSLEGITENFTVYMYQTDGKILYEKTFDASQEQVNIHTENFVNGIYFIKLITDKQIQVIKWQKN